jgi:hypothetical protein
MKTAKEIIDEVKKISVPNEGVKALAREAWDDPETFCIIDDDDPFRESYRQECPDRGACHSPDFMLACLQTRSDNILGKKAVEIYNKHCT